MPQLFLKKLPPKAELGSAKLPKVNAVLEIFFPQPSEKLQVQVKIYPSTSESSSSQTAEEVEPIVKCHTILEMGSYDLSPHNFGKGPKRGLKINFEFIFCQVGVE